MTARWNSSAGACTGRVTQWSILPTVTAPNTDRTDCQSPQPTAATRSAAGSMARTAASTSMPSRSCPPTPPMTSATGRPAARRSRIHGASSAPAADDDLIVRAIPFGQLPMQDLPGARFTADDHDGRLCPGTFTAHVGGQPLMRRDGNAR